MHFLGGLWIVFSAYYIFHFSNTIGEVGKKSYSIFILLLTAVLTVGILWEVFEYLVGAIPKTDYVFDTCLDLAMDILGGVTAYFFISKITRKKLAVAKR